MSNTKLLKKIFKWSTIGWLSLALAIICICILVAKINWPIGRIILIFTILGGASLLAMGPNAYYKKNKVLALICYILLGLSALLLISCLFVGFSKGFVFAKITYIVISTFVPYYTIVGIWEVLNGRYKPAQIVYAIASTVEALYIDFLILGVDIINGVSLRLLIVASIVSGIFIQVLIILVIIKLLQDRKNLDNKVKEQLNNSKSDDKNTQIDTLKEQKVNKARFCNKCGNKVSREDVFCKNCGNKLK